MKNTRLNNQSGFASIVEVIVASVIFTMAAFGIFTAIADLRPEGVDSSQKLEAMLKAKGKLDELRRELSPDAWNTGNLAVGGPYGPITDGDYTYSWTVSNVGGGLNDYVRKVDFTITY